MTDVSKANGNFWIWCRSVSATFYHWPTTTIRGTRQCCRSESESSRRWVCNPDACVDSGRCGVHGAGVARYRPQCSDAWCPQPASSWYVSRRRSAGYHGHTVAPPAAAATVLPQLCPQIIPVVHPVTLCLSVCLSVCVCLSLVVFTLRSIKQPRAELQ